MLAGIEETLRTRNEFPVDEEMSAIASLLDGLIDYAGLYPPVSLDMGSAVRSYLEYGRGAHSQALGRFIIDLSRVEDFRRAVGDRMPDFRLSVIASSKTDWNALLRIIDDGAPIETLEIKAEGPTEIECILRRLPLGLATYFEVPVNSQSAETLDAICAAGARVKLRMGGLVVEAFPSPQTTIHMVQSLAERHLMFKATAGLHHPLRSHHPFTYAPDSPIGWMHGFVNLCCAAAMIHFGGDGGDAMSILQDPDRAAWHVTPNAIAWRSFRWSAEQLHEVRQEFLNSIGSCSFAEPIEDLEALGWL
jgi:hypothetical protein